MPGTRDPGRLRGEVPALGRPCNGCAGLSPDSNVEAARYVVGKRGLEVARFNDALEMFNAVAINAAQGEE